MNPLSLIKILQKMQKSACPYNFQIFKIVLYCKFGRVYFLLRSISPSQIHLRFKTEKPSQIHLKCEKGYILKSTSSDNLLKTISRHTRWTFSIRIPSQILLKSPSSDNLLKTISAHSQMEYVFYFSKPS